MLFSAKISELQTQLTAALKNSEQLTAQVSTLNAANEQLTAANAECKERFDADQVTIRTLTEERDGLQVKVTDLTAKLGQTEASIEDRVIERVSATGVPAIKRDPAATDATTEPGAEQTGAGRTKATWGRNFGARN